ncbi:4'-phosphopantetheinyl transferase [Actinoplanes sp. NPDC020271]|uniref:4'-phosphopantetheinyl transferase n=1 Tax=Actinoplanes sp. NPDC020271 TaxID=3363896 RepID=UPI0037BDAA4C
MLDQLLPPPVRSAVAFTDDPDEAGYPGEESLIATAAPNRRREILTARRCAREALLALGHAPTAILRGATREPLWPAGVSGSITHCAGFRAAAVAHTSEIASLGIDAEPHAPLPPRVLATITTPADLALLDRLAVSHPDVCWDRLLFSAKESIYKAWFPVTGRWLGFEDASLSVDPDAGTFTGHILIDGPLAEMHGRFLVDRGLIVTAVCL